MDWDWNDLGSWNWAAVLFAILFLIRYMRLFVHIASYMLYWPIPVPARTQASFLPEDVTVIMTTLKPDGFYFISTVQALLATDCLRVIVVTTDEEAERGRTACALVSPRIEVFSTPEANKRRQMALGLRRVTTEFVLLADDQLWFTEPEEFLRSALAPFENPFMGAVAVGKRVKREPDLPRWSIADLINFIACISLERLNFELAATSGVDGCLSNLGGRCALYRASIICNENFLGHFCHERSCFGGGPLHPGDDNCLTRWIVGRRWDVKFQYSEQAFMYTCMGIDGLGYFHSQLVRWARNTLRYNSMSLARDGILWRRYLWSIYAVYLPSLFNFALFTDAALVTVGFYVDDYRGVEHGLEMGGLVLWILCTKLVKLIPHFRRHPRDIVYFPIYVLFAYYHSFIKLWALFTVHSQAWVPNPRLDE